MHKDSLFASQSVLQVPSSKSQNEPELKVFVFISYLTDIVIIVMIAGSKHNRLTCYVCYRIKK